MRVAPDLAAMEIPLFVAGCLLLSVAAWLLGVSRRDRATRAFSLVLVALGGHYALGALGGGRADDVLAYASRYFLFAVPFAAAHFALRYRARHAGAAYPRAVGVVLAAAFAAVALAHLRDYRTFSDPAGIFHAGPLWFFRGLPAVALAALAVLFARDAARAEGERRRALFLASLGAVLVPLAIGGFPLFIFLSAPLGVVGLLGAALSRPQTAVDLLELAAALIALGLVARFAYRAAVPRRPDDRRDGFVVAGLAALALAFPSFLRPLADTGNDFDDFVLPFDITTGVFLALFAALLAWALLRHRLFGLDWRVRRTVKGGTLAGIFVAGVFVMSESAAAFLGEVYGTYVGIASAGLLVLAVSPLQRVAERVAASVVPHAKPLAAMDKEERLAAFREQAAFAWADGNLSRRERLRLDALRERLGLTAEETQPLESDAARAPLRPGPTP